MKTIIAEGATPDLAFNNQLDFELVNDATKAFSKTNQDINEFAKEYINTRFSDAEGLGAYIVLQKPKNKTTKTKYRVENVVNKVIRKWETVTNFVDDDGEVVFEIPSKQTTKAQSITKAKALAEELNKPITLKLSKQVSVGNPITAVVSLKKDLNIDGKYFIFGVENVVTDPVED